MSFAIPAARERRLQDTPPPGKRRGRPQKHPFQGFSARVWAVQTWASGDAAVHIALGFVDIGAAFARGHLLGRDAPRQVQQPLSQRLRRRFGRTGPVLGWQGDPHALIAAFDVLGQVIAGGLQASQNRWLRAVELVIQRCHRHRQIAHLARSRMQRRAQPQGHQRHQLHDGGEHQLSRVLAMTMCFEYLSTHVAGNARSSARRVITLVGACSSNGSTTACQISSHPLPQWKRKNTAFCGARP